MPGGMGKLILAVLVVASLAFTKQGGQRLTQPEIILSPTPPTAGQSMRIKYTGKLPATIKLDWHPSGSPSSVTIPANPGHVDIDVPVGAKSLIAIDDSGEAESVSTSIQ